MTKSNFLIASTLISTLGVFVPDAATAQTTKQIDIGAQSLRGAIAELTRETGLSVGAPAHLVEGLETAGVSGDMTPEQALSTLLQGTSLSYSSYDANGFIITRQLQFSDVVAQDAFDDEPFDLGTILLQGERVVRDLFSTASSVEVFDGDTIEDRPEDNDLESVFENAANVTTFSGNTAPHIRGINSAGEISGGALGTLLGNLPRATVTVDGRNLSPNETIYGTTSVFDTEAVEVFRGPQTTSQGANAIGGAINVRTRNPVFEFEAAGRAELATDNGRALSAMINTPLSDSIALRFVYDYEEQDTYFDYVPAPGVVLADVLEDSADKVRQEALRLKLLFEPQSLPQLSTQLTLSYSEFSGAQNQFVSVPLSDLETEVSAFGTPSFFGDTLGLVHDIEYDFLNGFVLRNRFQYSVADSTRSNLPGPADNFDQEITDRSNETILEFAPDSRPVSGIFGLFYRESEDIGSLPGTILEGDRTGYGIFSEVTYDFQNGFDVTAGLRYQKDEASRLSGFAGLPPLLDFDGSFEAFLPKFSIGYQPTDNTRFALQVSRGYNPGGVGIVLTDIFAPPYEYDEETVTNFELSVRHRSADGRFFVAANLFYSDYEDYQLFVSKILPTLVPPLFSNQAGRLFNVDNVQTYGLEVTAEYLVRDDLTLSGSLGLLDTDVGNLGQEIAAFTGSAANNGNELPLAPNVTLNVGADYQVNDRLSVGGRVNYTGGYFSNIENDASTEAGDYVIVDFRAAYELSDTTELYGYVSNVFDTRGEISVSRDVTTGALIGGSVTEPREIGIGIRATF
ncbi:MAG: TonB-dependent receptor [Pseudomonadota bacterium]